MKIGEKLGWCGGIVIVCAVVVSYYDSYRQLNIVGKEEGDRGK